MSRRRIVQVGKVQKLDGETVVVVSDPAPESKQTQAPVQATKDPVHKIIAWNGTTPVAVCDKQMARPLVSTMWANVTCHDCLKAAHRAL